MVASDTSSTQQMLSKHTPALLDTCTVLCPDKRADVWNHSDSSFAIQNPPGGDYLPGLQRCSLPTTACLSFLSGLELVSPAALLTLLEQP